MKGSKNWDDKITLEVSVRELVDISTSVEEARSRWHKAGAPGLERRFHNLANKVFDLVPNHINNGDVMPSNKY